jgi:HEAT repeat protein
MMASLSSRDGMERQRARIELVSRGKAATPLLLEGLKDPRMRVRWESAKALACISDPAAADALVASLEDDESGVRWLSAEALAALGREGLKPILHALIDQPESTLLRQGSHHICHALASSDLKELVEPVLDALEHTDPVEAVPVAAHKVLNRMR